jgi:hypothetical protein
MQRADHWFRAVLPDLRVSEYDLETSVIRRPRPELGCCTTAEKRRGSFTRRQILTFDHTKGYEMGGICSRRSLGKNSHVTGAGRREKMSFFGNLDVRER